MLYGVPIEQRRADETVPLNSINNCYFTADDKGLLFFTSLFDDHYGLGYLRLDAPQDVRPVEIVGTAHDGSGELEALKHLSGDRYLIQYDIDGCSIAYEGTFDELALALKKDSATDCAS